MRFLRTNTAVIVTVGPFYDRTDGVTIETALTITNERITLTADTDAGSAPTNILDNITGATSGTANDLNYITGNDAGLMQIELAAADTNRLGRMLLSITDAANHVPVFHEFMVLPAAIYDWLILGTVVPLPANVTTWLGTAAATPTVAGVPEVDVTHWIGTAAATPTVAGVPEVDLTHVGGATTNVSALATNVAAVLADTGTDGVVVNAAGLAADAVTEIQAGLSTLTAAGIRTAVGLASANLDTQLTTIDDLLDTEVAAILAAVDTEVGAIITTLGTPAGASLSADIAAIEAQTDDIGAAGAGLTALPWNAAWDAEVQSEVTDALNAYDPPTNAEMEARTLPYVTGTADSGTTTSMVDAARTEVDDYWNDAWIFFTSGTLAGQVRLVTDFVAATDTMTLSPATSAAVGTHTYMMIPAAQIAGASAPTTAQIADAVWDELVADHAGAGSTGLALAGATAPSAATVAAAVWDEDATAHQTQGSFGQAIGDPGADTDTLWGLANTNLNATVSSRASQTSVDTVDDFLDTEVAAILAAVDTEVGAIVTTLGVAGAGLTALGDTRVARLDENVSAAKTLTAGERTSIADALLTRDWSVVAGEAARSVLNALRFLRNRWSVAGVTLTVTKEDDTTAAWTSTVTVDATADPITGSDPA